MVSTAARLDVHLLLAVAGILVDRPHGLGP